MVVSTDSIFAAMNKSTVLHILSFLGYQDNSKFANTCKNYFALAKTNELWKPLVFLQWETMSHSVPVPSYYEFFKRRTMSQRTKPTDPLIENCMQWEFECPATLDKFTRTALAGVDFCSVCQKNVYLVHNMDQLKEKVAANQCVGIDFDKTVIGARTRPRVRMMGRMRRTPLLSTR